MPLEIEPAIVQRDAVFLGKSWGNPVKQNMTEMGKRISFWRHIISSNVLITESSWKRRERGTLVTGVTQIPSLAVTNVVTTHGARFVNYVEEVGWKEKEKQPWYQRRK